MAVAKIASRIFKIEPVDGPPFLLVEIDVDCPECGDFTIALAGHHLKTIRDIVIEAIDLYPELASGEARIVDRMKMRMPAPGDPRVN